ncbi:Tm-1-like ATP-binding domain-containing protein [Thalassotalea sp. PLHSN55]|uniref:Tm-1-like ATP-binding domain-containing protein n=1 Tax=Thalassotalea sp. PLHSN55 TaxID=3435888 RepID=UPI003F851933
MTEANNGFKRLAILGTLDTRGDEVAFLKTLIEAQGHQAVVIDMGVMGEVEGVATYSREQVASAGGKNVSALIAAAQAGADRADATKVMINGATSIVSGLVKSGEIDGILGLGGSTAAASGAGVMVNLPIGFPKLLLTTFTKLAPIGEADITVMQAPVDLVGMNAIVAQALSQAAGALIGMAQQKLPEQFDKPLVGITALGVTTPAVQKVTTQLEQLGFEAVVFHATTDKLNTLIEGGAIKAVIDLTSFETLIKVCYTDEQIKAFSGATEVDRTRLAAAEKMGIPQIIAPGGLDLHILPGVDSVEKLPEPLQGRAHAMHGPDIMLVRSAALEMEYVGKNIAERANRISDRAAVVIPLNGFSDASREGSPLQDSAADQSFIDAFKGDVTGEVNVVELQAHINDDSFADEIIKQFKHLIDEEKN